MGRSACRARGNRDYRPQLTPSVLRITFPSMLGTLRGIGLLVAMAAFGTQAGTAGMAECLAMAPAIPPVSEHTHHQSPPDDGPAPNHGTSHCVCVASCRLATPTVEWVAVAAPPLAPPMISIGLRAPSPVLSIVARHYTLPPGHAPPLAA